MSLAISAQRRGAPLPSWLMVLGLSASLACGGHSRGADVGSAGLGGGAAAGAAPSAAAGAEAAGAGGVENGAGAGAGASAGTCAEPLTSPQAIAATPRANPNLELLALKFSSGIVADQTVYDRLGRDVGAIRALDSAVASIDYFAPDDGRQLLIRFDATAATAIVAHTYHAWDCLNDAYGLTRVELMGSNPVPELALLELKGIYNLSRLGQEYAKLPGIITAEPNLAGGDGPTICVTRDPDLWHYVFDEASGDCPAGCIDHVYHHFATSAEGKVSDLGELTPELARKYASLEACR